MRTHLCLALVLPLVFAVGCGRSITLQEDAQRQALTTDGGGDETCEELASSAREEVSAAIDAHQACTVDADCETTGLSALCFDSCSRAVNANAHSDIQAARAKVNDAQCLQFSAQGCKVIIPPCIPPTTPTCVAGKCQ